MAQMLLGQNPNVLNMFPGLQRLLPNTSLPSIPTITAQPTYQGEFFYPSTCWCNFERPFVIGRFSLRSLCRMILSKFYQVASINYAPVFGHNSKIKFSGATITEEPQSPPTHIASKPTQDSGLSSPNVINLLTKISQNLESFKSESVQNWNTLEETITRQNQILAERNKIEEQRLELERQRFQFELKRAELSSQSASSSSDQPMTEHMSS